MAARRVLEVVDTLHAAGLTLELTPELALKVSPASVLTPDLRDLIRISKDMLVGWLQRPAANDAPADPDTKVSPRVEATPAADIELSEHYARAHEADMAMSRADADTFNARMALFTDKGVSLGDAERLAERLVIRDREGDDRRLCLECSYYGSSGRCVAAATGRLPGVSARLEPVPTILWRCDAFGLRKALTSTAKSQERG